MQSEKSNAVIFSVVQSHILRCERFFPMLSDLILLYIYDHTNMKLGISANTDVKHLNLSWTYNLQALVFSLTSQL